METSGSLEHGTVDHTPVHLHHVHCDPRSAEGRLETPGSDLLSVFGIIDHQASSSSASGMSKQTPTPTASGPTSAGATMVMRSARSTRQFHQSLHHPYQRPQSATPGAGPSTIAAAAGQSRSVSGTMREAQVPLRFVHHNLVPVVPPVPTSTSSVVQSVMPSAMPSPASATGRIGFGSVTGYEYPNCCVVPHLDTDSRTFAVFPYPVRRLRSYSSQHSSMLHLEYPTTHLHRFNNLRARDT